MTLLGCHRTSQQALLTSVNLCHKSLYKGISYTYNVHWVTAVNVGFTTRRLEYEKFSEYSASLPFNDVCLQFHGHTLFGLLHLVSNCIHIYCSQRAEPQSVIWWRTQNEIIRGPTQCSTLLSINDNNLWQAAWLRDLSPVSNANKLYIHTMSAVCVPSAPPPPYACLKTHTPHKHCTLNT